MLGMHELGAYLGAAHTPFTGEVASQYVANLGRAGIAVMFCAPGMKSPIDLRTPSQKKKDLEAWRAEDPEARARFDMPGGYALATSDTSRLRAYVKAHYGAPVTNPDGTVTPPPEVEPLNVAINPRMSSMAIVDVDTPQELAAFRVWSAQLSGDPTWEHVSVTVSSPGKMKDGQWLHHGGGHIYFRYPLDTTLPIEELPGVLKVKVPDVGSFAISLHSSFVLIPPSVRAEGEYQVSGPAHDMPVWFGAYLRDEIYRRQSLRAEAQRVRSTREHSEDLRRALVDWYPSRTWDELLGQEGWMQSGTDRCGCPVYARPGGSSPKSATAHIQGCKESTYVESPDPPLHIWTSSPNGSIGDMVDAVGSSTLSKLQVMAAVEHQGSIPDAVRAAVAEYLEEAETTYEVTEISPGVAVLGSTPAAESDAPETSVPAEPAQQPVPAAAAPSSTEQTAPPAAPSVPAAAPAMASMSFPGFAPIGGMTSASGFGAPAAPMEPVPAAQEPPAAVAAPEAPAPALTPYYPSADGSALFVGGPATNDTNGTSPFDNAPDGDDEDSTSSDAHTGQDVPSSTAAPGPAMVAPNGIADPFHAPPVNPFAMAANKKNVVPQIYSLDELDELPPPEFLVQKWIQHKEVSAIIGPPNSGKSAMVIDIACCVASERNDGQEFGRWKGKYTMTGKVLYIAGEGFSGVVARIKAWEKAHNLSVRGRLDVMKEPFHLLEASDQAWFEIGEKIRAGGYIAVVVDTLATMTSGMDENSAQDMTVVMDRLKDFVSYIEASVILVHHTAKGTEHARGSSALHGALASQVLVRRMDEAELVEDEAKFMEENGFTPTEVRVTKQKDAAYPTPLKLTLREVLLDVKPGYKGQFGDEEMPSAVCLADWAGRISMQEPALTIAESPTYKKRADVGPDYTQSLAWAVARHVARDQSGPDALRVAVSRGGVCALMQADRAINIDGLAMPQFRVEFDKAVRRAIDKKCIREEGTKLVPAVPNDIRHDRSATLTLMRELLGIVEDHGVDSTPVAPPAGPPTANAPAPWATGTDTTEGGDV